MLLSWCGAWRRLSGPAAGQSASVTRRQGVRAKPWADGLGEWGAADAGDGNVMTLGSAVTVPTLGHLFLGYWASPGVTRWLTRKGRGWTVGI